MPVSNNPEARPASGSSQSGSGKEARNGATQLSGSVGVPTHVGSVAIDRGLLNMGGALPSAVAMPMSSETVTDAEIMLRVKIGDESAFTFLVQKYRRQIVGFMYRMCRNPATAEELAQEVFLRVYRSRESYEASAKFNTWLYRIATNLAVNHARDTRHERPENLLRLDDPDQETGATPDLPD